MTVYYEDGLKFLRMKHDEYDLIINDAIDPLGHTAGLFTKEFYGNCFRALKDDGIMQKHAQEGVPHISNKPRVSGTYTDVFFRLLAVRVCVKKISSAR